mmetsp:Transcript_21695/g.30354  ORF Transcript_21695/g.30354 Transcript_21695/m.30354 type:complete len:505 (-) Transcript_21695:50-1564(-)
MQFVAVLERALKENKPIVMVHRFDTPFPTRQSAPESVQSVFDYVAVKFLPHHGEACWEMIMQRAKRENEDISTDIFLSHKQSTGQGIALALYRKFTKMQKKVFLDIKAQFNLHDLKKIVAETKLFVFIATEGIFDSFWCWEEFKTAIQFKRPIVIVRSNVFPETVKAHYLPYLKQVHREQIVDYDAAYLKYCVDEILDVGRHQVLTKADIPFSLTNVPFPIQYPSTPPQQLPSLRYQIVAVGQGYHAEVLVGSKWETLPDINQSRNFCTVATSGGVMYVMGGDQNGHLNSCEKFDSASQTWVPIAPMNIARSCFGAAVVQGKIYALGGMTREGPTDSIEEYDPVKGTWRVLKAHLDTPNHWFGAAASQDAIYIVGGLDKRGKRKETVVKFSLTAESMEVLVVTLNPPRNSLSAAYHNGILYAVGGWSDRYCPVVAINLQTLQQQDIPMKTPKYHAAAAVLNGKLIVAGGHDGNSSTTVECLDLSTRQWSAHSVMHHSHTTCASL